MARRPFPQVLSITLKTNRLIKVEVDRYTMFFKGQPTDAVLTYRSGMVHGKRDPTIDPDDYGARISAMVAREVALQELRYWVRENPVAWINLIQDVEIWLDPSCTPMTPEAQAANTLAIERLIDKTVKQLPLFPPEPDQLP